MTTLALSAVATVTLSSSGNGTASAGPSHTREVWFPTSVSISSTGTAASNISTTPTAMIYSGLGTTASDFVDGTYNVQLGSSSMITGQVLYPGLAVYVVWSGANPNVLATMVISGTRSVP